MLQRPKSGSKFVQLRRAFAPAAVVRDRPGGALQARGIWAMLGIGGVVSVISEARLHVHRLLRTSGNKPERQHRDHRADLPLLCHALSSRQSGNRQ
ncbi:hypothetical protein MPL3356_380086 [Mesorhizobium plurifarium]|uniref:Uncharacterized protein n=1 Tax=Mesorhizobium plurifarium TaxID=69974 RepID=A0A090FRW1_MESPL|nr:hypothetical protein MPL3356_380086 [Mesorhizobium plurifarium]